MATCDCVHEIGTDPSTPPPLRQMLVESVNQKRNVIFVEQYRSFDRSINKI